MSQEKELLARGAELVTGDLILNRKTVGRYRNGEFQVSEDGLMELAVIEVTARPVVAKPKAVEAADGDATPRKPRKPKAAAPASEPEPETPVASDDPTDDLTALLNGE